jgi:uncharacterized protein YcbK (DUF882 family)
MTERRSFLKGSLALASSLSVPGLAHAARVTPEGASSLVPQGERILRFYNTHTGESLRTVFLAGGQFVADALQDINKVLRDHRSNTVAKMDPQLLLLLDQLNDKLGNYRPLHIISGYRSPETNRKLAAASGGVARHSMHLEGKAIDIRIPGLDLANVKKAAASLKGGGVGYYPSSQFVHMDTGRVRYW